MRTISTCSNFLSLSCEQSCKSNWVLGQSVVVFKRWRIFYAKVVLSVTNHGKRLHIGLVKFDIELGEITLLPKSQYFHFATLSSTYLNIVNSQFAYTNISVLVQIVYNSNFYTNSQKSGILQTVQIQLIFVYILCCLWYSSAGISTPSFLVSHWPMDTNSVCYSAWCIGILST